jgi:flagellar biosynthesis protein FlhB
VNKKIKLLFLIMVVSAALISAAVAQEGEFKRINALNYHKSMFSAQQPTELLRIT